jgi:hypothetical protein
MELILRLHENLRDRKAVSGGGVMNTQAIFTEILLSGFFATACFRAKAESLNTGSFVPQRLFMLTDRLERLRRSRWQWCAMALVLVLVRLQMQTPIVAELTVLAQFLVFLALPSSKQSAVFVSHS